jgi:outer membrane PBP1 activator LpoA protein
VPAASTPAPEPSRPAGFPHIALLLPTGSDAFGMAASAVRQGFEAASKKQGASTLPVRLYQVSEDTQEIIAAYRQALLAGATLVVGPLTRDGVTALAQTDLVTVPTLALNVPDRATPERSKLYVLSLQVESEAQQVARLALREGRRKAFTVTDHTALGKRMRDAFAEEFSRGGGYAIADYAYATDSAALDRLKQAANLGVADMVFLAVDAGRARSIASYLSTLPAYGTSQLNPGGFAPRMYVDVGEMRFVDMPWMLQADHPAVMTYSRGGYRQVDDLERLYALGIDAFRVAQELLAGKREIDIDGVTGRLLLGPDRQVQRELLVAIMSAGKLTVLGENR